MTTIRGGGAPAEPDQPQPGEPPQPTSPEPPHKPPAKAGEASSGGPADMPPAGPHAKPVLTDAEKTPGAGVLPEPDEDPTDSASS